MKTKTVKPVVWSCGGGVQSTAIAALLYLGRLPEPAIAVMADTGRESTPVMDYMRETTIPALESVGITLHIAPHSLATVDLYSGADGDTLIIPAFTDKGGQQGMLPKYCSQEWKTRVVQRFCRQYGIADADQWIGFTTDEMDRCRVYREDKPWQHVYPLIDLRMSRGDCMAVIKAAGWPEPHRSSCWMCPFRSDQEWLIQKTEAPEDFAKAVELERDVRKRDPNAFLHRSLQPLDSIVFDDQPDLFSKPCNAGGCFT